MIDNNFKTINMRVETFPDEEGITTLSFDIGKKCRAVKAIAEKNFFTPAMSYGETVNFRKREKFAEFEGIKEINHRVFYELVEHYAADHVVGYYVRQELVKMATRILLLGPYRKPVFSTEDKAALIENELIKQNLQDVIFAHLGDYKILAKMKNDAQYLCILHENFNKDFYIPLIREKVWREDFFNHLFIYEDKEIQHNDLDEHTLEDYINAEKILSINISDQYHFGRIKFVESAIDKDECVQLVQELFAKYGVTVELFAEDSEEMLIHAPRRNFYEKKIYPIVVKLTYFVVIPLIVLFFVFYGDAWAESVFDNIAKFFNWIISLF